MADPLRRIPAGAEAIGLVRNVRVDARWAIDAAEIRRHAAELVALAPDVILASGGVTVGPAGLGSAQPFSCLLHWL
jgi:hypothetical protein